MYEILNCQLAIYLLKIFCNEVFCSSNQVGVKTSNAQMLPTNVQLRTWETFSEDVSTIDADSKLTVVGLLEQLNVTRDTSDYLWYTTRYEQKYFYTPADKRVYSFDHIIELFSVEISSAESFLHQGQHLTLTVQSAGHALHVFINGQLSGANCFSFSKLMVTF